MPVKGWFNTDNKTEVSRAFHRAEGLWGPSRTAPLGRQGRAEVLSGLYEVNHSC